MSKPEYAQCLEHKECESNYCFNGRCLDRTKHSAYQHNEKRKYYGLKTQQKHEEKQNKQRLKVDSLKKMVTNADNNWKQTKNELRQQEKKLDKLMSSTAKKKTKSSYRKSKQATRKKNLLENAEKIKREVKSQKGIDLVEIREGDTCVICMNPIHPEEPISYCKNHHVVHFDPCFKNLCGSKTSVKCPTCREEISCKRPTSHELQRQRQQLDDASFFARRRPNVRSRSPEVSDEDFRSDATDILNILRRSR